MRKSEYMSNGGQGVLVTNTALRKEGERVRESEHQSMRLSIHEVLSKGERKSMRVQKREYGHEKRENG